mmetsp:Transcript_3027/g.8314  ORF Transcript_3027/g.8314 Transcript_3027/m.8314 type:complete len:208 (-) Transcript_3027:919-1542(-)
MESLLGIFSTFVVFLFLAVFSLVLEGLVDRIMVHHASVGSGYGRPVPTLSQKAPLRHATLPPGAQQMLLEFSNGRQPSGQNRLDLGHLSTDHDGVIVSSTVHEKAGVVLRTPGHSKPNRGSGKKPRKDGTLPPIAPIFQAGVQFNRLVQRNISHGSQGSLCELRSRFFRGSRIRRRDRKTRWLCDRTGFVHRRQALIFSFFHRCRRR